MPNFIARRILVLKIKFRYLQAKHRIGKKVHYALLIATYRVWHPVVSRIINGAKERGVLSSSQWHILLSSLDRTQADNSLFFVTRYGFDSKGCQQAATHQPNEQEQR